METDKIFMDIELPKVLKKEELVICFEKMKLGDMAARERIITCNIRLVINEVVKKYLNSPYDLNELISIGLIGLIKSVDTFDLSKGIAFSSYSIKCINNEILFFLRKAKKYVNDISLDQPIGTNDSPDDQTLEDTLVDINSEFEDKIIDSESYKIIRKIVEKLPDRDRNIVELRFGFLDGCPMTQQEIADQMGISRAYVSNILIKVMKVIMAQLQKLEVIEPDVNAPKKTKGIKVHSIYELFNGYTKAQVDEMLSKLSDDDRILISLRYGNDLENPIISEKWTNELSRRYYRLLVPKMKMLLLGKNIIPRAKRKKVLTEEFLLSFEQMLNGLTLKEVKIIGLKLGYINNKCFSNESIANYLKMDIEEVNECIKKVLLLFDNSKNKFVNCPTNLVRSDDLTRKRKA